MKNGLILPDIKDLLTLYLMQAKEEATYVSNQDIANILMHVLETEDLQDIINIITNELH